MPKSSDRIRVLILDDEPILSNQIRETLQLEGFDCELVDSPANFRPKLKQFRPNILLLDRLMPGKDGIQVIKEVKFSREFSAIPIIMLTACGTIPERLEAFESGVDDYVVKPFNMDELIARIQALHNRATSSEKNISTHGIEVDVKGHVVRANGEEIHLTITEFNLLKELLLHKGEVISREELCRRVLGKEHIVIRAIDVHITSLRKKLNSSGKKIKTIRGVGYKISN